MKKDEINYLEEHGFTIGDIKALNKIHSERVKTELSFIEQTYVKERTENIRDTLKTLEEEQIGECLENITLNSNNLLNI